MVNPDKSPGRDTEGEFKLDASKESAKKTMAANLEETKAEAKDVKKEEAQVTNKEEKAEDDTHGLIVFGWLHNFLM